MKHEFIKLDDVDLKVACWIYEKHPKALFSYIEYVIEGKRIDANKVYKELLRLLSLN